MRYSTPSRASKRINSRRSFDNGLIRVFGQDQLQQRLQTFLTGPLPPEFAVGPVGGG